MTFRIVLAWLLLAGLPALAFAEEAGAEAPVNADLLRFPTEDAPQVAARPQIASKESAKEAVKEPAKEAAKEAAKVDPKRTAVQEVRIALELRQLTLSDAFIRLLRDRRGIKKLPPRGAGDVLDPQQASLLLAAATGERRSHETPAEVMLKLTNGERHNLALPGPRNMTKGSDAVTATLTKDRQAVQLQLTWARRKDTGRERFPPLEAVIPLGSHLIVHTATLSEARSASSPLAELDQYADRLLGLPQARPELQQVFLLITPTVASEEREERFGKKEDDRSIRK